jgi:threonine aldolase
VADHQRARRLADAVRGLPGFRVVPPETNVVLIDLDKESQVVALLSFLEMSRILILKFGTRRLRAVTHRDVDDAGIARAIAVFGEWARRQEGE